MIVRTPRAEELESLMGRMTGERVELSGTPCWIAEEDGKILGMVACRLVWQIEPLTVFPEVRNKATRRRVTRELYRAASLWLGDRERNATGVHLAFAVTRDYAVLGWAKAMGWFRQYRGAALVVKEF